MSVAHYWMYAGLDASSHCAKSSDRGVTTGQDLPSRAARLLQDLSLQRNIIIILSFLSPPLTSCQRRESRWCHARVVAQPRSPSWCVCARVYTHTVGERERETISIANSPLPENYSLSQSMNRWLHNCGRGFFCEVQTPAATTYYYFMDQWNEVLFPNNRLSLSNVRQDKPV